MNLITCSLNADYSDNKGVLTSWLLLIRFVELWLCTQFFVPNFDKLARIFLERAPFTLESWIKLTWQSKPSEIYWHISRNFQEKGFVK